MASEYDLIVIGGGPAGATAATIAARGGLRVLLLEADSHPRVHVGESLLPGIIPILDEMGALAEVEAAGFTPKSGATQWGWGRLAEWDLWFRDTDAFDHAWLVDRSRFDTILFRAAQRAGVEALEHAAVKSLAWQGAPGDRLTGVRYRLRGESEERVATAPFTIDASGQAALIARQLGMRHLIAGLQHRAAWAHFSGAGRLPPPRQDQALFVASTGRWMWHFPLGPDQTSVGIIQLDDRDPSGMPDSEYDRLVAAEPRLAAVLGPQARRVTPVRQQRDWSYRMDRAAGPGFILAGDSSGFIDPILSSGVHLGMHAAWHAAKLISQIARGEKREEQAIAEYQAQHSAIFGDLLRMVRFYYQQNLHRDDYFWESKRILVEDRETELRPRKAFMILTSGLVRNLALDSRREASVARREAEAYRGDDANTLEAHEPDHLGFVCFHLRMRSGAGDVFLLIEPRDASSPSLFRTRAWDVNCLAPRLGRDPLSVPELAPPLRAFERTVQALDDRSSEPLAAFWRRTRERLVDGVRTLFLESMELLRVFGE